MYLVVLRWVLFGDRWLFSFFLRWDSRISPSRPFATRIEKIEKTLELRCASKNRSSERCIWWPKLVGQPSHTTNSLWCTLTYKLDKDQAVLIVLVARATSNCSFSVWIRTTSLWTCRPATSYPFTRRTSKVTRFNINGLGQMNAVILICLLSI